MHAHAVDDPRAHDYLPGMGRHALLPMYDPFTRLLGLRRHHATLIEQAAIRHGTRVLEIGCGTGNLALAAAARHPAASVVGLDPDDDALARARRKAGRRRLDVRFDHGYAQELPYADASFDRVLSALMFHHLGADEKRAALAEVGRVLAPGGTLHLMDIGGPATASSHGMIARLLRRSPVLDDNLGDRIPELMTAAGLEGAAEVAHRSSRIMGGITYVRATAPDGAPSTG